MSVPLPRIVIDARPQGPNGPLAGESVLGRTVLAHHLDLARRLTDQPVLVHARIDDHPRLRNDLMRFGVDSAPLVPGSPPENALILRTDRLYELRRLKRAARRGLDAERAVLWRLDSPSHLQAAEDELLRRSTYQPIGRFWALKPARALARRLEYTWVRPNHLTLSAAASVLGACGVLTFAPGGMASQIAASCALSAGLVLDTADGHLARLQGTSSAFGRWLDSVLDELGDMALHAAIAWSCFARDAWPGWLVLGMAYASAKYLFVSASNLAEIGGLDQESKARDLAINAPSLISRIRAFIIFLGHADLRWHLWIILAALGRLELALIGYTAYFALRFALGFARKAAHRG